jgi:hypothetical protein
MICFMIKGPVGYLSVIYYHDQVCYTARDHHLGNDKQNLLLSLVL